MTTHDPTEQTLAQLGAVDPEAVARQFSELRQRFDEQAARTSGAEAWRAFVVSWTGRKSGTLSHIGDNWLKPAPPALKRAIGQELNRLKDHIEAVLAEKSRGIEAAEQTAAAARSKLDLSLPGAARALGTRHLIRQTYEELQHIFLSIGFSVVEGPEIETPYYNFEALNIHDHNVGRCAFRHGIGELLRDGRSAGGETRGGGSRNKGRLRNLQLNSGGCQGRSAMGRKRASDRLVIQMADWAAGFGGMGVVVPDHPGRGRKDEQRDQRQRREPDWSGITHYAASRSI